MSSGRIGRVGAGLFDAEQRWSDAQKFLPDAEYVKKGAELSSLTGVAMTHLGNGDIFYAVDTTAGAVTVTLPAVAGTVGQTHIVKRISGGSNACNIVAEEGTAILDGSATHSIAAQYDVRCYFSDGVAWRGTLSPSELYLTSASASATYVHKTGDTMSAGSGITLDMQQSGNAVALRGYATINAGYSSVVQFLDTNQAGGAGFVFLSCRSDVDGVLDQEFAIRGDGNIFGDGAAYNTPADYGEYRETFDGQDIQCGITVVIENAKVRPTRPGDDPCAVIGVVRPKGGEASLATNAASLRWTGRYLKDAYGAYIRGKDGERIQNPDFKSDIIERDGVKVQNYTPRSERPEWVLIGMLGAVAINKGQLMGNRWIKMRDINDDTEEWHIR